MKDVIVAVPPLSRAFTGKGAAGQLFGRSQCQPVPGCSRTEAQLSHLADAAATWREFEAERAALTAAMEADRRRLGLLRRAISGQGDQTSGTAGGLTAADLTGTDVTAFGGTPSDAAKIVVTRSDEVNGGDTFNGLANGGESQAGEATGLVSWAVI